MESVDAIVMRTELLKLMDEEKLESLIREKEEKFHGLLTREAAIFAISKEMSVKTPQKPITISQLAPATKRAVVLAKVNKIFEIKKFEKNGKEGRVCRIFVGDESSERALVLWNDDTDYVERGKILTGDLLEIKGAYLKGDELALGYGGAISVLERNPEKKMQELSEGEAVNITADIFEAPTIRRYERDGVSHEMGACTLSDSSGKMRIVLWEPHARALEGANPGDSVRVEGARLKNGEVQTSRFSKVVLMQKPITPSQLTADFEGEMEGKVKGVEVSKEGLLIAMEGGGAARVFLNRALSLRLLGLKSLPDDVTLETLLKLKGGGLTGSILKSKGKAKPEGGRPLFSADKLLS